MGPQLLQCPLLHHLEGQRPLSGRHFLLQSSTPFGTMRGYEWIRQRVAQQGTSWSDEHSVMVQPPYAWESIEEALDHPNWWAPRPSHAIHLTLESTSLPKAPAFWKAVGRLLERIERGDNASLFVFSLIAPAQTRTWGQEWLQHVGDATPWTWLKLPEADSPSTWGLWVKILKDLLQVEKNEPPFGQVALEQLYWAWKLDIPLPEGDGGGLEHRMLGAGGAGFEEIEAWLQDAENRNWQRLLQRSKLMSQEEGWNFSLWATRVVTRVIRKGLPPPLIQSMLQWIYEAELKLKNQKGLSREETLHLMLQIGLRLGKRGLRL